MFNMYFLEAAKPLTKSFKLNASSEIEKTAYPIVKNFTSHEEEITSLKDIYLAIKKHAAEHHCVLKGKLQYALNNESRADSTKSNDSTRWALIDLDGTLFKTPEDFMNAYPELRDVSYVVQYSASQGIYKTNRLSCHIFIMLDKEVRAPLLKTWLQSLNLTNKTSRDGLTLSRTGATLKYTVDITTCQNDKIIYIAPPIIGKGITCSLKDSDRIQYIAKKEQFMNTNVLNTLRPEAIEKECRVILDTLRDKEGYKKLSTRTKYVGEHKVLSKPGEITSYEVFDKEDDDFIRFNFNGGDSKAYYHPRTNFELIHSFKDPDIKFLTKEILPTYYKECVRQTIEDNMAPTDEGDELLAFRDFRSSTYWNGTWNPKTKVLDIVKARDTTQLSHFLAGYGRELLNNVVPVWRLEFKPQETFIVDSENKKINMYQPTEYMSRKHKKVLDLKTACPYIYQTIMSAVSDNQDDEMLEHFLNWLAVIYQHKIKTITSWVLMGVEGTGKGVLVEHILKPTLGPKHVVSRKASELEENYNGWMEYALIAFIDEIQVAASSQKSKIMANLKNQITDPTISIRNMHSMAYETPSYINFIFSSNKPDPVMVDENDRRFNFGIFQSKKLPFNREIVYEKIPKELENWTNYIMTRKADINQAATIIENKTRQNVIDASRVSGDEIGMYLKKGMLESMWDSMPDLNLIVDLHGPESVFATKYAEIIKQEFIEADLYKERTYMVNNKKLPLKKGLVSYQSRLTRDELYTIFEYCVGNIPASPNKFTALLRHRGIQIETIRDGSTTTRGIYVQWIIEEKRLSEIVAQIKASGPKPLTLIKKAKT